MGPKRWFSYSLVVGLSVVLMAPAASAKRKRPRRAPATAPVAPESPPVAEPEAPVPPPAVAAPVASPEVVAPTGDLPSRPRIVFLGVEADALDPAIREGLEAVISRELGDLGTGEVVSPRDLRAVVKLAAYQQMVGCNEANCSLSIGEALRAQQVINASVQVVGERYALSLQRFDTVNEQMLGRVAAECDASMEALYAEARRRVPELFGIAARVWLWNQPEAAEVSIDGQLVARNPQGPLTVNRAGEHEISVVGPGYTDWSSSFEVKPGQDLRLRALNLSYTELEKEADARWRNGVLATLSGATLSIIAAGLFALAYDNDRRIDFLDLRTTPQSDLDAITSRTLGFTVGSAGAGAAGLGLLGVGLYWLIDNPAQDVLDAQR